MNIQGSMDNPVLNSLQALERRAMTARQTLIEPDRNESPAQMMGFMLAGQRLATDPALISETLPASTSIQPLPGVQHWVRGMLNLRGEIICVSDLRQFYGLPAEPGLQREERILIVRQPDLSCGLVVDAVAGLRQMHPQIQTDASLASVDFEHCLTDLMTDGQHTWQSYDFTRLLSDQRFIQIAA